MKINIKASDNISLSMASGMAFLLLSLIIAVFPILSSAYELDTGNDLDQIRREMRALRDELQAKNNEILRLQQGLDALEARVLQAQTEPAVKEERVATLEQEVDALGRGGAWQTSLTEKPHHFLGGQVWFKGGYSRYDNPRRDSLLTIQDDPEDQEGWHIAGGLDLPLFTLFDHTRAYSGTVLGEIYVEYFQSQEITGVAQAVAPDGSAVGSTLCFDTNAGCIPANDLQLAVGTGIENVFTVGVAPKYRFDHLGARWPVLAKFRPWIIPAGLTFNVNTPVDQSITNISPGGFSGLGAEYLLFNDRISLGFDARYYWGPDIPDANLNRWAIGAYTGINF